MKYSLTVVVALLLAACGGGSSGGGNPIPGPTATPTTNYAAKLIFTGPLAGRAIQSDLRQAESIVMDASATPIPIMIVSNISNGCAGLSCYGTGQQGVVQAVVSPAPASSPIASFADNAAHVTIGPTPTPAPGVTPAPLPTGVVAVNGVSSDGTNNVQSAGTATASIGSPVNASPTTAVYQYFAVALDCIQPNNNGGGAQGWSWSGSSWSPQVDPTKADIYVTGTKCSGAYGAANDDGTLHFPGGGTFISTDTPFAAVLASQWANTETSVLISALQPQNADGSFNALLIAKTRDGLHTFKMFPSSFGGSVGDFNYEGPAEVSGSSVDGF